MTPEDRRAIAESKKLEHRNKYVCALKIGARYSFILRSNKTDAMNTYGATRGYRTAVARNGVLVAAATHDHRVFRKGN